MNRGRKCGSTLNQDHNRTVLSVGKDIPLLKSVLQHNLYQTDGKNWDDVLKDVKEAFSDLLTWLSIRILKGRVNLLKKQLKAEELVVRNAKEEECTERGNFLQDVISILESMDTPINLHLGVEESSHSLDEHGSPTGDIDDEDAAEGEISINKTKQRNAMTEKVNADKERDQLLSTLNSDLAPSPKDIPSKATKRIKRIKLTFEDELVQSKHKKRLQIEEQKLQNDLALETRRLDLKKSKTDLENAKLQLELKREERTAEEAKRRDKIANIQFQSQQKLYYIMLQLAGKKE